MKKELSNEGESIPPVKSDVVDEEYKRLSEELNTGQKRTTTHWRSKAALYKIKAQSNAGTQGEMEGK